MYNIIGEKLKLDFNLIYLFVFIYSNPITNIYRKNSVYNYIIWKINLFWILFNIFCFFLILLRIYLVLFCELYTEKFIILVLRFKNNKWMLSFIVHLMCGHIIYIFIFIFLNICKTKKWPKMLHIEKKTKNTYSILRLNTYNSF